MHDRFIAVDVEIASRSPMSVCSIGAVRIEDGREIGTFKSLVHVTGPVRFGRIHGLEPRDLADAPGWSVVWRRFIDFSGGIRQFIAYKAEFDRAALLAMCAIHNVRVPVLRFDCAAEMIRKRFGGDHNLQEALKLLGLSFPGRPHEPLADARAAAAIALACRVGAGSGGAD